MATPTAQHSNMGMSIWLDYIYNPAAGGSFLDAVFNLHGIAGKGAVQKE